ncbi:protein singed wings 2 isoform X3 [Vespa velutina]|uniref:protein singed wings 2 isoform X3 n=1 Tax=Vespa velutina TaxID=202808 RepID=UPI001FB218F4|nr:protein singed wings 2 isoform X3 [Vespa velutina]
MWLIIILMITFESRMMFSRASAKDNETLDCHRINLNIELSECHLKEIGHRLTCFAGIDDKWKTENETVENLVLCNWPNTTFDPQEALQGFPLLRKFKIANSNLTRLMTPFPEDCQFLEKVNLTHNKLELLPVDVFANLSNLRIVDLRYNYLKEIDLKGFNVPTLSQVYLFGNPLKCTENISWILDLRNGSFAEKIVDREKLRCSVPYNGRPLVPVVEIIMVPTYALENVLLQSGSVARLYLGNNPWRCDCLFTPGFQDLLIRYTNLVRDINEVKCAAVRGDENSNKQVTYLFIYLIYRNILFSQENVIVFFYSFFSSFFFSFFASQIRDLTRTEICISSDENSLIYPLDILNIILAFLIFLIIGKLLYDYWSFKKTGKLPWIVSKIP